MCSLKTPSSCIRLSFDQAEELLWAACADVGGMGVALCCCSVAHTIMFWVGGVTGTCYFVPFLSQ